MKLRRIFSLDSFNLKSEKVGFCPSKNVFMKAGDQQQQAKQHKYVLNFKNSWNELTNGAQTEQTISEIMSNVK